MLRANITGKDFSYESHNKLGVGSYAAVYLGTYEQKKVAIKISPIGQDMDGHFLKVNLYQREVDILKIIAGAALDSQNSKFINSSFAYGTIRSENIIISEYANAGTLQQWIFSSNAGKGMDWSIKYTFAGHIAAGLDFLHKCNVLHCDIKPENVLIHSEGEEYTAKLTDFGLSKVEDATLSRVGSPSYMAPELILGLAVNSGKSDVFSFSCVLWEMATIKYLVEQYADEHGINDVQKLISFMENEQRASIPEIVPPKIAHLITWGWKQKPADRPSAEVMVEELKTDMDTLSTTLRFHGHD